MSKKNKILVVESTTGLRETITRAFSGNMDPYELEFYTHDQITGNPSHLFDYAAAIINFHPDPQVSYAIAWRFRSSNSEACLTVLVPSVNFMIPAEALDLAVGPVVTADDDGLESLPRIIKTMLGSDFLKEKLEKKSMQDMLFRNLELRDITNSMARHGANLIRLRNELAREKSKVENVINCMTDGIAFFDTDGRLEVLNPVAKKTLSLFFGGERISTLEQFKRWINEHEASGRRGGEADSCEVSVTRFAGKAFRVRFAQVCDSSGKSTGSLALLTDITREKEYDKLKNDFTNMISHELRTPLTSIRAAVDNFIRGTLGDVTDKQRKFLELIARNVERQDELVGNLLDLAQWEAGQMKLTLRRTNLRELVHLAVIQYSLVFKDNEINLKTEYTEDALEVEVDQSLLSQAIHNVFSNALKFTGKGDEVIVRLTKNMREDNSWARISIYDTGRGINRDQLEGIFDKYTQAADTGKKYKRGIGLGLAICKEIMRAHGGSISVESEPGSGSVFHMDLPVCM